MNCQFNFAVITTALLLSACAGFGRPGPETGPPAVQVGDSWADRELDGYNGRLKNERRSQVTAADAERITVEVTETNGKRYPETYTSDWGRISVIGADKSRLDYAPPYPAYAFPLRTGKSWKQQTVAVNPATGTKTPMTIDAEVLNWETVTTPAGNFSAYKILRSVYLQDAEWWRSNTRVREFDWYAPAVNRVVRRIHDSEYERLTSGRHDSLVKGDKTLWELIEYRPAAR